MATAPILAARILTRGAPLSGKNLLRDVGVELFPGDRVALQGESGAGKTVLLRALAQLDAAEGTLILNGENTLAAAIPHYRSKVLYLHQSPSFPEGSVRNALQEPFSWRVHRDKQYREANVVAMLDEFGKDLSFLDEPTANLSGGERQILALLRSIQLAPCILLLDEPTAALDANRTATFESILLKWSQQGPRAFVWVSHDQEQANRVANRFVRIAAGRIVDG